MLDGVKVAFARVADENLSVFRFGRIIGGLKKQNNRWVVDDLNSAHIARIAYFAQTLPQALQLKKTVQNMRA
jgi:hypothetical protein